MSTLTTIGQRGPARDVLAYIEKHLDDRAWAALPVPLHDDGGHITSISLPTDLTPREARRIVEMVQTWVIR